MRMSQEHCRVRDLQAATRWFERVWQIAPVFQQRADGMASVRIEFRLR